MFRYILIIITLGVSLATQADVTLSFVQSNHMSGKTYSEGSDYLGTYKETDFTSKHILLSYYNRESHTYLGALNKNSYGEPCFIVGKAFKSARSNFGLSTEYVVGGVIGYEEDQLRPIVGNVALYGWAGISYTPPKAQWISFTIRAIPGVATFAVDINF